MYWMSLDPSYEWDHTIFVFLCWLTPFNIISSRFISVLAHVKSSFLFKAQQYSIVGIDHILLICWWTLGLAPLLTGVNNAAVNTGTQAFVWVPTCGLLRAAPAYLPCFLKCNIPHKWPPPRGAWASPADPSLKFHHTLLLSVPPPYTFTCLASLLNFKSLKDRIRSIPFMTPTNKCVWTELMKRESDAMDDLVMTNL